MELLRGQPAIARARAVLAARVPAIEIDPAARRGGAPALVCLATAGEAALIDARGTPELTALLSEADRPLAAVEAKEVYRALWPGGHGPDRWACTRLTSLLLAAGREAPTDLAGVAARLGLPPPPAADAGFAELVEATRAVAVVIERLMPELRQTGMAWVSRIEAAAVAPVAEMEARGMPFDGRGWQQLATEAADARQAVAERLLPLFAPTTGSDLFGQARLNLDSDLELKAALAALGHPVPDMRRATLAGLPAPLGPLLAEYRELSKLASAYGDNFLQWVGTDGRIHPTFEQIGASTGRMACHSPNLQAVVKGGPHRRCFRAPAGRRLVIGDYSACELRILAEMSGDPVFAEAFARGEDLHARVATAVFGVPVSKKERPELRDRAKAINFGLAYGMGAPGLARAIDSDLGTAQQLLERYFQTFPRIQSFLEESARQALERGYAVTMTGRRLMLERDAAGGQAERIAKNMPIQGTSADITKIALARLRRALRRFDDAYLVNTVHDELVVECAEPQAAAVERCLADEMRAAGAEVLTSIPIGVDTLVSDAWDK